MKRSAYLVAISLACLALPAWAQTPAAPPATEPAIFGFDLGSGAMRAGTKSAVALLDHTSWGGAYLRAWGEVSRGIQLGVGWWRPTEEGTTPTTMGQAGVVDVRYGRDILPWFHPYARLGLGAVWLDHRRSAGVSEFSAAQLLPLGLAAAGLELSLPGSVFRRPASSRWRFNVGVGYEVGWLQTPGADWTLKSGRDLSPAVAKNDLALGAATLAGVWQRIAFLVRF